MQILYDCSPEDSAKVPSAKLTRQIHDSLDRPSRSDPTNFYDSRVHKPYGAEPGDLEPMLWQLSNDMNGRSLYTSTLYIEASQTNMLHNGVCHHQPRSAVNVVGIYTKAPLTPSDPGHGLKPWEFEEGKPYNAFIGEGRFAEPFSLERYRQFIENGRNFPKAIDFLGVKPGDVARIHEQEPYHFQRSISLGVFTWNLNSYGSSILGTAELGWWGDQWGALRVRKIESP